MLFIPVHSACSDVCAIGVKHLTIDELCMLVICFQDNLEMGSAAKVVDCILALKSFQELKQMNNQNGYIKHIKSPLPMRMHTRAAAFSSDACRHLDLSSKLEKMPPAECNFPKREGLIP